MLISGPAAQCMPGPGEFAAEAGLRLGVCQAGNNLRHLSAYRRELGAGPFTSSLALAAGGTDLTETIAFLLGHIDADADSTG